MGYRKSPLIHVKVPCRTSGVLCDGINLPLHKRFVFLPSHNPNVDYSCHAGKKSYKWTGMKRFYPVILVFPRDKPLFEDKK